MTDTSSFDLSISLHAEWMEQVDRFHFETALLHSQHMSPHKSRVHYIFISTMGLWESWFMLCFNEGAAINQVD